MPIPPRAVRFNAQKGLDIRAEQTPSNRAGTPVGLARARDLAAGVNVSEALVEMLYEGGREEGKGERERVRARCASFSRTIWA